MTARLRGSHRRLSRLFGSSVPPRRQRQLLEPTNDPTACRPTHLPIVPLSWCSREAYATVQKAHVGTTTTGADYVLRTSQLSRGSRTKLATTVSVNSSFKPPPHMPALRSRGGRAVSLLGAAGTGPGGPAGEARRTLEMTCRLAARRIIGAVFGLRGLRRPGFFLEGVG